MCLEFGWMCLICSSCVRFWSVLVADIKVVSRAYEMVLVCDVGFCMTLRDRMKTGRDGLETV